MKNQSISVEKNIHDEVDKRDLVNIDLYHHEIKVIEIQLEREAEKYKSKEVHNKHLQLKNELIDHMRKLELFRKSCELQQDNYSTENYLGTEGKSFFEHLKAFEKGFKDTRNKVNDFLNQ